MFAIATLHFLPSPLLQPSQGENVKRNKPTAMQGDRLREYGSNVRARRT